MSHAEYLRRRRVWRYLTGMNGPQEEPWSGDEVWLKSGYA
jgi:hypothetical protein